MSAWKLPFLDLCSAVLLLVLLLTPQESAAQVEAGRFVLSASTALIDYQVQEYDQDEVHYKNTSVGFGPGGTGLGGVLPGYVAVGFGYAFHRRVVPMIQFAAGADRWKSVSTQYDEDEIEKGLPRREFMFRPTCEFLLNPETRAVVGLLGGLDFRHTYYKFTNEYFDDIRGETRTRALGPVLGLVAHFFLVDRGSLDVSAVFVRDFLRESDSYFNGSQPGPATPNRVYTFSLLLGVSLWPGKG